MEEAGTEVDSRDISGDVIDQFPIRKGRPSSCSKTQRTGIDSGNQAASEKDTGRCAAVEKVIGTK
jgi:hypothetical protein